MLAIIRLVEPLFPPLISLLQLPATSGVWNEILLCNEIMPGSLEDFNIGIHHLKINISLFNGPIKQLS